MKCYWTRIFVFLLTFTTILTFTVRRYFDSSNNGTSLPLRIFPTKCTHRIRLLRTLRVCPRSTRWRTRSFCWTRHTTVLALSTCRRSVCPARLPFVVLTWTRLENGQPIAHNTSGVFSPRFVFKSMTFVFETRAIIIFKIDESSRRTAAAHVLLFEQVSVSGFFHQRDRQRRQSKQLNFGQSAFFFFPPFLADNFVRRYNFRLYTHTEDCSFCSSTTRKSSSISYHKSVKLGTDFFYSVGGFGKSFVFGGYHFFRIKRLY